MTGVLRVLGQCYVHKGSFWFDPDRVNVVLIDPVTDKPPDVDADPGTLDEAERVERSVGQPVCVECCLMVNQVVKGPKFVILDTSQIRVADEFS